MGGTAAAAAGDAAAAAAVTSYQYCHGARTEDCTPVQAGLTCVSSQRMQTQLSHAFATANSAELRCTPESFVMRRSMGNNDRTGHHRFTRHEPHQNMPVRRSRAHPVGRPHTPSDRTGGEQLAFTRALARAHTRPDNSITPQGAQCWHCAVRPASRISRTLHCSRQESIVAHLRGERKMTSQFPYALSHDSAIKLGI